MSSSEPLEIELLLTSDQRRLTVDEHHAFLEFLAPIPPGDEIDEEVAQLSQKEAEQ
jgi:hypothetical protein